MNSPMTEVRAALEPNWNELEKILRGMRSRNEQGSLELTNWIADNKAPAPPKADTADAESVIEAIDSAIESHANGELGGWELQLIKRRVEATPPREQAVQIEVIGEDELYEAEYALSLWAHKLWCPAGVETRLKNAIPTLNRCIEAARRHASQPAQKEGLIVSKTKAQAFVDALAKNKVTYELNGKVSDEDCQIESDALHQLTLSIQEALLDQPAQEAGGD